ncbi:unnamed protein product [Callosobruchus maculatus]|uniref:Uncharacterized protein n=1 Tax=Callosobruchus maculatus TaxID=64391 RepID=A0A653C9Z4_CALMS|nr:unnamed protein product [Callosobruchus maculatus]
MKSGSTSSLREGKTDELNKSNSSKSLPEKKSDTFPVKKVLQQPRTDVPKDINSLQQKPLSKKSVGDALTHKNKMAESVCTAPETTVKDISQVDIEQTVFKPKPVIIGTVGEIEEKKAPPKVMVDAVEIVESPKKKDKKFRFNLDVEVKAEPPKIKMPIQNGVVEIPTPKDPLVIGILKKKPLSLVGQVLEEKQRALKTKKIVIKKETDSNARNIVDIVNDSQVDKKAISKFAPLSLNKDKVDPNQIPKRKIFTTKVSQSSTDSSAPSSPVKLVSPFTKNDDVFVKRTVVVPRNKTAAPKCVENEKDTDSKFKDNDDFARPVSPLRQHGEIMNHEMTDLINKTDSNTVVQKKADKGEVTTGKVPIKKKVIQKKTVSPPSSEKKNFEANKEANEEPKLEQRDEAKANEDVKLKDLVDDGLKRNIAVKAARKQTIANKEAESAKDKVTELLKTNEKVAEKIPKKEMKANGEVEAQIVIKDSKLESKADWAVGVEMTKDKAIVEKGRKLQTVT